jgi:hypothetical protein
MTAEIAVMNEEAVALAADSAVTGPAKIFTSANKIFALSKYHPVALMVYDTAVFHGVPWETIVKQYRRKLGKTCFPTLEEHAAHFLEFFDGASKLFPADSQQRNVAILAITLFRAVKEDALRPIRRRMVEGEKPSRREVVDEIEKSIQWHHGRWKNADMRRGLPKGYREKVNKRYSLLIKGAIDSVFENAPLSPKARQQLRQLVPWVATKNLPFLRLPTHSGIVIAGFGSDDVFPRLRRFDFEGIIADKLKCIEEPPLDIGPDNKAVIVPFAQREQVDTFMAGIDERLRYHLHQWWHEKLDGLIDEVGRHLKLSGKKQAALAKAFTSRCSKIVGEEYEDALDEFSRKYNVDPIIDIVGMLPKDELAEMAESLVNLTSFKRRVTPEAETVGGPIDVAVISRGDGFIWIKRKHYFKTDLNPHFLANYYEDENHG